MGRKSTRENKTIYQNRTVGKRESAMAGINAEAEQREQLMKKPSMDEWLKKAKADEHAANCGMYLFHNGVVRRTAKAQKRC